MKQVLRNWKILTIGVSFVLLDLFLSAWFVLDWKPRIIADFLNRFFSRETEVFSFKNIYFPYKDLTSNQTAKITCFYQNSLSNLPTVNLELGFIQQKNEVSSKKDRYVTLFTEKEKLNKGGGAFSKEFNLPKLVPPGWYNAYLKVYDEGRLRTIGSCYTDTFKFINEPPPLMVNLKAPSADVGLMPIVQKDNKTLIFSLESNSDLVNIKPRFIIKDSPIKNKTIYSLSELEVISISKNENKEFKVNLSSFNQTGSFVIDLQFTGEKTEVVSSFPVQEVYIGMPPNILDVEETIRQGNSYKYNIKFTKEISSQKLPLELSILALDSESHSCGFSSHTITYSQSQSVSLGMREDCQSPKFISFLLKPKGFDLALARAKK